MGSDWHPYGTLQTKWDPRDIANLHRISLETGPIYRGYAEIIKHIFYEISDKKVKYPIKKCPIATLLKLGWMDLMGM